VNPLYYTLHNAQLATVVMRRREHSGRSSGGAAASGTAIATAADAAAAARAGLAALRIVGLLCHLLAHGRLPKRSALLGAGNSSSGSGSSNTAALLLHRPGTSENVLDVTVTGETSVANGSSSSSKAAGERRAKLL
jgi:hypothetical protein